MPPAHLRKIKMEHGYTYKKFKEEAYESMLDCLEHTDSTVLQAVGELFDGSWVYMNRYGMDKFAHLLTGCVFLVEHDIIDGDYFWSLLLDLEDIETGEYDYLFSEDDLKLMYADIEKFKQYIAEHPNWGDED